MKYTERQEERWRSGEKPDQRDCSRMAKVTTNSDQSCWQNAMKTLFLWSSSQEPMTLVMDSHRRNSRRPQLRDRLQNSGTEVLKNYQGHQNQIELRKPARPTGAWGTLTFWCSVILWRRSWTRTGTAGTTKEVQTDLPRWTDRHAGSSTVTDAPWSANRREDTVCGLWELYSCNFPMNLNVF